MIPSRLLAVASLALLAACAAPNAPAPTDQNGVRNMPSEANLTEGTNRDFSFSLATTAPDEVWRLWTTPATWGDWDRGLTSASLAEDMALGSKGEIVPLSGPRARFVVTRFEPKMAYAFRSPLPLAGLQVERSFSADRRVFTHRVSFDGPFGFLFALIYGPRFRAALPDTMRSLNALAEGRP